MKTKQLTDEHVVNVVQALRMARFHEVPIHDTPFILNIVQEVESRLPGMSTWHRQLVGEIFILEDCRVVRWNPKVR